MTKREKHAIEFLKRISKHLSRYTYQEISGWIDYNVGSVPVAYDIKDKIYRLKETTPRDLSVIYRARENTYARPGISTMQPPYNYVSEISIIPEDSKDLLTNFGRCNKPKEPRFYASNNLSTACVEALSGGIPENTPSSAYATVGRWKIKEPLVLAEVTYSEKSLENFLKYNETQFGELIKHARAFQDHCLTLMAEDTSYSREYTLELISFFADEFAKIDIKSDNDYIISNHYCDQIFDYMTLPDGSKFDGILYPSVANAYLERNLVLHPRAMEKIEFLDAMMMWIVLREDVTEFIPIEQHAKADSVGKIMWKDFGVKIE